VGLAAAVIVAAMVGIQEATLPDRGTPAVTKAETERLFSGIPQDGFTLGRKDAPVTVVEFVDMQCPFCAQFATRQLDDIVRKYVRTGRVKMELRTLAFIGPDSVRAGQAVGAAAEHDKAWDFAHAFFARQGHENSGYLTDDFLDEISAAVPGLDAQSIRSADDGQGIALAQREAQAAKVESTPSFLVNGKAATPDSLEQMIGAAK
jgi:protein-disulfide isomerase